MRRLHLRRRLAVGLVLLGLIVLLGAFAGVRGRSPNAIDTAKQYQSPSLATPMGTDEVGRDVLARTLYAIRVDLPLAVVGIALALVVGVSLGTLAGLARGLVDGAIGRAVDGFQAFPALLLALLVASAAGPGLRNLALIIGLVFAPVFFRMTRAQMLSLRQRTYVEAARSLRRSWTRIAVVHLLPNAAPPILAQAALGVGYAVTLAAGLGFLGLGPPPPAAEWGAMIGSGAEQITAGQWWLAVFPGLFLTVTVFAFALIADGIQEGTDPRLR
jgi:ABC-type dipeptide/oligopeptide/nickel transport system permease subunit